MQQEDPRSDDIAPEQREEDLKEEDGSLFGDEDLATPVSKERAERFYDRMRASIRRYLDDKGKAVSTSSEYLLLAPDVFVLLWRLVNDARVNTKDKLMLGTGIAYYLFPLDIMPEALLGPVGYLDDLVFAVFLLNRMLKDTDAAILRDHWSGTDDVLSMIRNVLGAADKLVGKDFLSRFKK
jgi:uncharacterized membrane protein YkvA (DUF1232 family)